MCEFIFIKGNPLVMELAKLPFAKCLEGSDNPHPLFFLCQPSNPSFNVSFKRNSMSLKSKKKKEAPHCRHCQCHVKGSPGM